MKSQEELQKEAVEKFRNQTWEELLEMNIRFFNNAVKNGAAMPDIIQMMMHNTVDWKTAQKLTQADKIAQLVQAKRKQNDLPANAD